MSAFLVEENYMFENGMFEWMAGDSTVAKAWLGMNDSDEDNTTNSTNAEDGLMSPSFFLHRILQYDPQQSVVELCLRSDPDAIKLFNDQQELPLHVACSHGVSVEVLEMLYRHYPEAALIPNSRQQLPLHCACGLGPLCVEMVLALLQLCPSSCLLAHEAKNGDIPLHLMMRMCSLALSSDDSYGQIIRLMIQKAPGSIFVSNHRGGHLPLHIALEHRADPDLIRILKPDA